MAIKEDIVAEARKWLDTPYHHQARVIGHGVDCIGLIVGVCKALALPHADSVNYGRMPEGDRLIMELRRHAGREVRPELAEAGDILVFRFLCKPRHVAIKTNSGMIHSWAQMGKVVEHGLDKPWQRLCVTAFEFPGVACN
jgi:NlpC/P60 family putative phage cell wall peptidase